MKRKVSVIAIILVCCLISFSFQAPAPGLDWKFQFGKNYLLVPLVIEAGVVYVGGEEGIMYALDAGRGSVNWKFKAEGAIAQPPLVENKLIYFCTKAGKVYCLNASSGKLIWVISLNTKLVCTPILNGQFLCVYSRNEVIGLDKANGLDLWKTPLKISDNPAMVAEGDDLFFADDMKVYAINAKNGNINWDYDLKVYGVSDVLCADNKIIYINDNKVFALDKASGKKKWMYELGEEKVRFQNKACFLEGKILISFANELIALRAENGEEVWTFKTKVEEELYSALIMDNTIWLSSRGKMIFNIAAEKGKKIENYEIEIVQESAVRYENKHVFFSTEDGHAIAYKLL